MTSSIRFDQLNVVISGLNKEVAIPLSDLLMNNGEIVDNAVSFKKDQSVLNYYDCIKDGTNPATLQQLNIYPDAGANGYPVYNSSDKGLHIVENKILEARRYNLTLTAWLKLKKGHELDPKKDYNVIFKESGLGYEPIINGTPTIIKTFGSFIDPLSKTNGQVWPPDGNKLLIEESFMNLMGFGDSKIEAEAINNGLSYDYNMFINCGNGCSPCKLNFFEKDKKYTLGNNIKKIALNETSNASEKVKYIIIKEWGDKLQVIIYIMYSKLNETIVATMLTCDMVVFITCLVFQTACIYTGALSDDRLNLLMKDLEGEQSEFLKSQLEKRHYSIVEYKPGNKFEQALNEINLKTDKVIMENNFFIESIKILVDNSDTPIMVGQQKYVLDQDFYISCLKDITVIQTDAVTNKISLFNQWKDFFSNESNKNDDTLSNLYKSLKIFESQHLLVPFIKIKKGTTNTLTVLSTKSYSAQLPCVNTKKSFGNSKETFQVLALKNINRNYNANIMRGGGVFPTEEINFNTFVADDDEMMLYNYTYDVSDEEKIDFKNINPEIGINPDRRMNEEENVNTKNLLEELNNSFDKTMRDRINEKDTYYTLFVYNSYINGCGITDFNMQTYDTLSKFYELEIGDEEIMEVVDTEQEIAIAEPRSKRSRDWENEDDRSEKRIFPPGSPRSVDDFDIFSGGLKKKNKKHTIKERKNVKKTNKTKKMKNKIKTKKIYRKHHNKSNKKRKIK
jgi:hypothetical protein